MHFDYSTPSIADPSVTPAFDAMRLDQAMTHVAARIVHDIVNPLGAIANGLELLELSGFPKTEEFQLMEQSVQNAQERIKVIRLAFGPVKTERVLPAQQLCHTLSLIFTPPRYALTCQFGETLSNAHARLICLLALCAVDAIPFGGTVHISETHLRIESATKVNLSVFEIAADDAMADPSKLHFFYALQILSNLGTQLDVKSLKNGAEIVIPQG